MEKNIWWVAVILLVLVAFFAGKGIIRKTKWEVSEHDRRKALSRH